MLVPKNALPSIKQFKEGKAKILASFAQTPTKALDVFYNPNSSVQRDITISLLKSLNRKLLIADPLAGSGVRAIRFLLEAPKAVKSVLINDKNPKAFEVIKKNLKLNKIKVNKKVKLFCRDANLVLRELKPFDYIDIDPFGSPNSWLDSAMVALSKKGILAITATDTAALAGTAPRACLRKYWAWPLKCYLMHEIGIRILIRKVQLIGLQYEKFLTPIYSHMGKGYYRIYFLNKKGKLENITNNHGLFYFCFNCLKFGISACCNRAKQAGPLWLGAIWMPDLADNIYKNAVFEALNLSKIIADESRIQTIGFYDIATLCSKLKIAMPSFKKIFYDLKNFGFKVARSSFLSSGIRSDAPIESLIDILKKGSANVNYLS